MDFERYFKIIRRTPNEICIFPLRVDELFNLYHFLRCILKEAMIRDIDIYIDFVLMNGLKNRIAHLCCKDGELQQSITFTTGRQDLVLLFDKVLVDNEYLLSQSVVSQFEKQRIFKSLHGLSSLHANNKSNYKR